LMMPSVELECEAEVTLGKEEGKSGQTLPVGPLGDATSVEGGEQNHVPLRDSQRLFVPPSSISLGSSNMSADVGFVPRWRRTLCAVKLLPGRGWRFLKAQTTRVAAKWYAERLYIQEHNAACERVKDKSSTYDVVDLDDEVKAGQFDFRAVPMHTFVWFAAVCAFVGIVTYAFKRAFYKITSLGLSDIRPEPGKQKKKFQWKNWYSQWDENLFRDADLVVRKRALAAEKQRLLDAEDYGDDYVIIKASKAKKLLADKKFTEKEAKELSRGRFLAYNDDLDRGMNQLRLKYGDTVAKELVRNWDAVEDDTAQAKKAYKRAEKDVNERKRHANEPANIDIGRKGTGWETGHYFEKKKCMLCEVSLKNAKEAVTHYCMAHPGLKCKECEAQQKTFTYSGDWVCGLNHYKEHEKTNAVATEDKQPTASKKQVLKLFIKAVVRTLIEIGVAVNKDTYMNSSTSPMVSRALRNKRRCMRWFYRYAKLTILWRICIFALTFYGVYTPPKPGVSPTTPPLVDGVPVVEPVNQVRLFVEAGNEWFILQWWVVFFYFLCFTPLYDLFDSWLAHLCWRLLGLNITETDDEHYHLKEYLRKRFISDVIEDIFEIREAVEEAANDPKTISETGIQPGDSSSVAALCGLTTVCAYVLGANYVDINSLISIFGFIGTLAPKSGAKLVLTRTHVQIMCALAILGLIVRMFTGRWEKNVQPIKEWKPVNPGKPPLTDSFKPGPTMQPPSADTTPMPTDVETKWGTMARTLFRGSAVAPVEEKDDGTPAVETQITFQGTFPHAHDKPAGDALEMVPESGNALYRPKRNFNPGVCWTMVVDDNIGSFNRLGNYIVTAKHVVETLGMGDWAKWESFGNADIAVAHIASVVNEPLKAEYTKANDMRFNRNPSHTNAGYIVVNSHSIGGNIIGDGEYSVCLYYVEHSSVQEYGGSEITYQCSTNAGDSGKLLFNANGDPIGVHAGTIAKQPGYNYGYTFPLNFLQGARA